MVRIWLTNRHPRGVSKYLGVSWYRKSSRWRAAIHYEGTVHHIGYFKVEEDAARAYDESAKKHHGEFANLNFK